MKKIDGTDPSAQSANIVTDNVAHLKALFPDAVEDGVINFDALKQLLGGTLNEREEKYGLNWHGKRKARQLALLPSNGTLRPCPEESVEWGTTKNLMIEGDNLEVLKLLQKRYAGKVKLIYIDPPYNTGNDFVYSDDFRDTIKNYLELTGQVQASKPISSNTESSGRFHTDWLNMIYPRLMLARQLLHSHGCIFISIDDTELANLRIICDEIFGSEHFCGIISRSTGTRMGSGSPTLSSELDYILVYSKTDELEFPGLPMTDDDLSIYDQEDERGKYLTRSLRRTGGENRREDRPSMFYPVFAPDGTEVLPIAPAGYESRWVCGKATYEKLVADGMIEWKKMTKDGRQQWQVYQKHYLGSALKQPSNLWSDEEGNKKATRDLNALFEGLKIFDHPKPIGLMQRLLSLVTDPKAEDIVMDFFAGSGTLGHAVMEQCAEEGSKQRFILVQLPEPLDPSNREQKVAADYCDHLKVSRNVAELTKERLRRAAIKIRDKNKGSEADLGFRVFKLDSSNIHTWDPNREDIAETLEQAAEHLKTDRTEEDVLFELLLKLGLDLTVPMETMKIAGKSVHSIGAGVLLACLSEKIASKEVEGLALGIAEWHKKLAPAGESQIVFRDSAFADDVAKTNMTAILQQNGLETVRSL